MNHAMGFDEIIGQEIAVAILRKAAATERISHAYLFSGLEGVGKTTTALAVAAAINCVGENRENFEPCGKCWSCKALADGNNPDIELISPDGSQTKIDQMREMRRMSQFAPVRSRWKVNIIERAESLNEDSASSILKILEEPPAYLIMILLTRNPGVMLPTIRSRCQLVRFFPAKIDELEQAFTERFGASVEDAHIAAAYSEGRPGKAIALLTDDLFKKMRAEMIEIAERLSLGDAAPFLRLSERFRNLIKAKRGAGDDESDEEEPEESGKHTGGARAAVGKALETAILWYRDLLSVKLRGEEAPLINTDCRDRLVTQAARYPNSAVLVKALETLSWAKRALEGNANIQLLTDVTMLRLVRAGRR